MAKLGIYKYFSFMLLVITLLISIFTIIGLFGGNANPVRETAMALIVYALPLDYQKKMALGSNSINHAIVLHSIHRNTVPVRFLER